jgi:site-specific DNA-adenine methylase
MLGKCDWIGVVFAGGMPEVPYLQSRTVVVNDLHRHIVNCARAVRDHGSAMTDYLERTLFHPDELFRAQEYCQTIELCKFVSDEEISAEVEGFNGCHFGAAVNYFVSQWMGRSGQASTESEFEGKISTRWTSSGGDSNTRFRSASNAIADFSIAFQRCNFTRLDFRAFLKNVKDSPTHGIYLDPPWPDAGEAYRHSFTEHDQNELAGMLGSMKHIKVVLRYGDHPLIRRLYREINGWTWRYSSGRTQGNNSLSECYISQRCD